MLKKLYDALFKPSIKKDLFIVAQLNDKIMPIDRGELYEDAIDEFLKVKYYGEVSGGGTQQETNGEIRYCDVEIKLTGILNRRQSMKS